MAKRRVVITGVGAVTAIGNTAEETWKGLVEGKNGVNLITRFDTSAFDTKFAFEVKNFDPLLYIDKKAVKRMDPYTHIAIASAVQAIEAAKFNFETVDKNKIGVLYGSGIGGIHTWETQHNAYLANGPRSISPFFVPMMISDIAAGHISIMYGLKGPNFATTSACATSAHAVGVSFMMIQRGSADVMVCGGSESSITPMAVGGFNAARAISTWNDRYLEACRPFDKDRSGFVMAEGAGALVLEEYEHAVKRGAEILGEIIGVGFTADAHHITAPAPEGEGAYRAMKEALRDGELNPEQIDHINAHGTSTELNDLNETKAIKNLFGQHAYKLSINSIKSMVGHLLGAAGAVESMTTILSIKNSIIPPTINLTNPDPECDLDYTPLKAKEREINYALSNSFGFGGHNVSLLFKKFMG
ncbi:MAG: beta-ketoacyl-ACP synthase II [Ignavibacteriales bacterium]|nr:beta-ketoacyl-ACP synthase II [Ignavibacteriales bacterium]